MKFSCKKPRLPCNLISVFLSVIRLFSQTAVALMIEDGSFCVVLVAVWRVYLPPATSRLQLSSQHKKSTTTVPAMPTLADSRARLMLPLVTEHGELTVVHDHELL